MTHQHRLHLAIACIKTLQQSGSCALTAEEISRRQQLPVRDCEWALDRLASAGLVDINGFGAAVLANPDEDVISLDVLKAVWENPPTPPAPEVEWIFNRQSMRGFQQVLTQTPDRARWEMN